MQINEAEVSENEKILLEEYKHKHDETEALHKMKEAKTGQVAEDEAISNIERVFEHVDGRNDGSTREMKPVEKPRAIQYSASMTTKKYGTLYRSTFDRIQTACSAIIQLTGSYWCWR